MKNIKDASAAPARADFAAKVRMHNERLFAAGGKSPAAFIRTFGCQQNLSDSEKLAGMLAEMGYALSDTREGADVILFNTCAVRENAEERVFGNVGALKKAKKQNPGLIIGLCGCMMQQAHVAEKIRRHYPYVDIIFGTHALGKLPMLIWQKLSEGGRVVDIEEGAGELYDDLPSRRDGHIKAWVPIAYGCNNFCTYCVVPFVRGRERSRELSGVVEEVRRLTQDGCREITLLGQNVNSYGENLAEKASFSGLLRALNELPGDFLIRFMTSHPKDCTHELIDTIADCPKVARHIHLPVQSGSDRILKAMNRRYRIQDYLELIDYAREKLSGAAFTSDIIVGFPGEEEKDFDDTMSLLKRVRYHSLFTFLYSKREGTKAAGFPDPVPREEKMLRFQRLLELQRKIGHDIYSATIGDTVRVLAEGPGKTGENRLTGRTEQNVIVEFDGEKSLIGSFVRVRVTDALQWALTGSIAQFPDRP